MSWVLGSGRIDPDLLPHGHQDEPDGAVFEVSTIRESFVEKICEKLSRNTGAALLVDYGHAIAGFGDTFQAV